MFAPREVYLKDQTFISVVFDRKDPRQTAAFHRLRSAFGLATDVEALDSRRVVLHLYPGGALGLVA